MARTPLVIGNWKLNKTVGQALELATELKNQLASVRDVEFGVAPVFTALHAVARRLEDSPVQVCAQNCHWEDDGAHTGEVSVPLLKDVGCQTVIVGHSERRQFYGDTDDAVGKKLAAVLSHNLRVVLCVGESDEERDDNVTFDRIAAQLDGGLAACSSEQAKDLVVAYEPVWAIGTGRTATPAQAEEVHAFIRQKLSDRFGAVAESIRIQYGGSVKPGNAAELMSQPNIDGALVGGAALSADSFVAIVKASRPKQ